MSVRSAAGRSPGGAIDHAATLPEPAASLALALNYGNLP
jgi:hypothetical protein